MLLKEERFSRQGWWWGGEQGWAHRGGAEAYVCRSLTCTASFQGPPGVLVTCWCGQMLPENLLKQGIIESILLTRAFNLSFRPHTAGSALAERQEECGSSLSEHTVRAVGTGAWGAIHICGWFLMFKNHHFLSPELSIPWYSFLLLRRLCTWSHRRHSVVPNFMSSFEVLFNSGNIWLTGGLCSYGKYFSVICRYCYSTPPIWRRNSAYALRH